VTRIALVMLSFLGAVCLVAGSATAVPTLTVRQVGTMDTVIVAMPSDTIDVELVFDTDGLSFEAYFTDLGFTPGHVSGIGYAVEDLTPLDEVFSASIVGDGINDLNQATDTDPAGSLAPGVYVLNTVSFTVDSIPAAGIDIAAFLSVGDGFFLNGEDQPMTPAFVDARVIPEPSPALLATTGLAGLGILSQRRRAGARAI
jgi:hypothetical protein